MRYIHYASYRIVESYVAWLQKIIYYLSSMSNHLSCNLLCHKKSENTLRAGGPSANFTSRLIIQKAGCACFNVCYRIGLHNIKRQIHVLHKDPGNVATHVISLNCILSSDIAKFLFAHDTLSYITWSCYYNVNFGLYYIIFMYWRSCTPSRYIGLFFWGVRGSWAQCHFLFSLVCQLCLALW